MTYIEPDIGSDEQTVREKIHARITSAFPGWSPVRGGLAAVLAGAIALVVGEFYAVLRLITRSIFVVFGREIVGVQPIVATPSTATSTWTSATSTFTVAAGTPVLVDDGAGGMIEFQVVADVTGTGGTATGVELVSQEVGAHTAGLTGPCRIGEAGVAYDPVIVLDAPTAGGADAETDEAYRSRLSERLQIGRDSVINGQDAAVLARQTPGVWRALAIDNYDGNAMAAADGHITVAFQEDDGTAVPSPVKATALAAIEAATIMGLTVHAVDVVQQPVKVSFSATAFVGYDPADVETRAEAAVAAYLASNVWGSLPFGDERTWRQQLTVRRNELIQVVSNVDGVDYVSALTLAKQADSLSTADVTLGTVPWTVASPGTITGTVTAGS